MTTLAPNDFTIELSASDFDRLSEYGQTLSSELAAMLHEHATEQHLQLLSELAQMFSEARFRDSLGGATDAAGLRAVFDRWEPAA